MTTEQFDIIRKDVAACKNAINLLLEFFKPQMEAQSNIQSTLTVIQSIGQDVLNKLGVHGIQPDPKQPWFSIRLLDGNSISVKVTDTGLRLRKRDGDGSLIKEVLGVSPNGIGKALLAL